MTVLRIIQISDTHLFADRSKQLLGVNTSDSLKSVVELLGSQGGIIDFVIVTGDLSQDYSQASYQNLADHLKPLSVPVYCVAGNHDSPDAMAAVFPRGTVRNDTHIVRNGWQFILLNSHKHGAVEGFLNPSQLNYLQECLRAYPHERAVIAFHHHPVQVGSVWLDKIGLSNAGEFWQVVAQYPNVHSVLFGHVHQEHVQAVNGVTCYSAPSTCVQFRPRQEKFGLEKLNQGYRWLEFHDDGSMETGVSRLADYIGVFDADSRGY